MRLRNASEHDWQVVGSGDLERCRRCHLTRRPFGLLGGYGYIGPHTKGLVLGSVDCANDKLLVCEDGVEE